MTKAFGTGEIVYDPTGIVGRTAAILELAGNVRAEAGMPVKGVYLNADRRTLFIIVDPKSFPENAEANLAKRVEVMGNIATAVQAWKTESAGGLDLAIRIGFELPTSLGVIPVDRLSEPSRFAGWRGRGIAAALTSMLGIGAIASSASAAEPIKPVFIPPVAAAQKPLPAVARPNLDVLFAGVFLDGGGFNKFKVSALGLKGAIPIGQQFGFQVDAAVGTHEYAGVGGHFFWRDPSFGLVGGFMTHEKLGSVTLQRYGAEAEAYLRNINLRGIVGMQAGDAPHSPFASLDLTFYVKPNLAIEGGAKYANNSVTGKLGIEWQPMNLSGISLFADTEWGLNNYTKTKAGVSFHFGAPGASLIDKARNYDPAFGLFNFTELGYALSHQ